MVALILSAVTVAGAAPLELQLSGCEAAIDAATLERLILLEWPDPPLGTKATVTCDTGRWTLALEAPGLVGATDQYELPALPGAARTRVLALIISERGRAFTHAPASAPPPPEPAPPLVESVRAPVTARAEPAGVAEPQPPAELPHTPLRDSIWSIGAAARSNAWRVGAAAVALSPFTLGPWRFGAEVRVQRGPFALALGSTIGTKTVELGSLTVYAITVEPELTVACVGGAAWRVCAAARGALGYGAISASSKLPEIETKRVDNAVLGGAAVLTASLRLLDWLALEADGRAGWVWGVIGSQAGEPVAAIGGGLAGASLALVASWGRP